jgi:uncharacterized protein (DUF2267 family)
MDELERFLDDVSTEAVLPAGVSPFNAASAVACTLMLRMSLQEGEALVAALPAELRPLFVSCARHKEPIADPLDREEFFARVAEHIEVRAVDAAAITRAVFAALRTRLEAGQVGHVAAQLPGELESVWTAR